MNSVYSLIEQLQAQDIHLYEHAGKIRVRDTHGNLTNAFRQQIRQHRNQILDFLTRATVVNDTIPRQVRTSAPPLSFAQQRLWFLDQLEPNSAYYNIPSLVRLRGELDVTALEQSFSALVGRHESLRTTFQLGADGEAQQVIHPSSPFNLSITTVSNETEAQHGAQLEAATPFNLSHGPLLRAHLFQIAPTDHLLLLNMHHIISDFWSMGILIEELTHLYRAYVEGRTPLLPELPIQYADYAVWQRDYLSGERLEKQLTYWREQLAGAPALLELPTDYQRPPIQSQRGAHYSFRVAADITKKLNQLAQAHDATLFMVLLAAFDVLLARYSRQTDIVVGSPIANRTRAEVEGLIGFFVNTLVFRTQLAENPSFVELLQQVRSLTLAAYEHQDLPFEQLVDELNLERTLSYRPLFQVVLVLQNAAMGKFALLDPSSLGTSLTATLAETSFPFAKFDLTLNVIEGDAELDCVFEYATDLFDEATIARMATHLSELLAGIVARPERPIFQLPLLPAAEVRQVVDGWNSNVADADRPPAQTIHARVEQQAARTPEAIALINEDEQLTYGELNSRANQLAHHLIELGVQADTLVAVAMERSIDMIVSLLAILKAGGAYVPIDPSYPTRRIRYILQDSAAPILLTHSPLTLDWEAGHVIEVDSSASIVATQPTSNPQTATRPDHLAYIIYTSGSTGTPKGVLVQHDNVDRLFTATDVWYRFNENDVWTFFHSYAFDFSVWEIWGALRYGGRLVIVPYLVSRTPEQFYQLLGDHGVTVLNQTPSAFRQLIQAEEALVEAGAWSDRLNLRYVIFGGEALDFASLQPWFARQRRQAPTLINMYGITETTVHVTYRPVEPNETQQSASLIGVPIPDLQLYVLDDYQQPVPIGVAGELYVGGAGVARGYLNRPNLTAERFIDSAAIGLPTQLGNQRLYRTGDLVRRRAESCGAGSSDIEYLGRIDNQVKIRGFRIELGEIEAVLTQHPEIHESVVLAQRHADGRPYLAAYVVAKSQGDNVTPLRDYLSTQLPDYMIPAAFVTLDKMPLTVNGKVDRKALPQPDLAQSASLDYVPPQTSYEALLVDIWQSVLQQERVGIHDNFFALGGDSILSIQVLTRIKAAGLSLSLQQLFQHQTIYDLARVLGDAERAIAMPQTAPFSLITDADRQRLPADIEDAYPIALMQMGMLFHGELDAQSATYHDIFSYHFKAALDYERFSQAIGRLMARHPILRTSFAVTEYSEPLQLVHKSAKIPLQISDTLRQTQGHLDPAAQDAALDAWFAQEKQNHLDWHKPPLIRFQIHRRTNDEFNLTLSFHHAILDGWSVASLMTELFEHYETLGDATKPPLSQHYRDFIALERAALNDEAHKTFWEEQLAGSTRLTLPTRDMTEPTGAGNVVHLSLNRALSEKIKRFANALGVPVKSVLLAAHLRVLGMLGSETDVLAGLVMNGRLEEAQGDQVLGLFLNTLPLRLQLEGGSWEALVRATFQAELAMLPYRRYPYAQIQRAASRDGHDLFSTLFNFVHFHVYSKLAIRDGVELLDGKFFEQTNLPLVLTCVLDPLTSEVDLSFNYDPTALEPAQVEAMAHYHRRALEAIVAEPAANYHTTSLLGDDERTQLIQEWNQTAVDFGPPQTLHGLFEAQAAKTPDATALIYDDDDLSSREAPVNHLSFADLNRRANQLAHHLIALGVENDTLVVVAMERSFEMVVSLLAVLKAGGAYVPVDPTYPLERIRYVIQDSAAPVLLTQSSLLPTYRTMSAANHMIAVDQLPLEGLPTGNPERGAERAADSAAVVIYTSGSTGTPKGAIGSHNGMVNRLQWMWHTYPYQADEVLCAKTSLAFGDSTAEIFGPMLKGLPVVIASDAVAKDPHLLVQFLADHKVTRIVMVPSLLRSLLDNFSDLPTRLAHLRFWQLSGEALSVHLVQRFRQLMPNRTLLNVYGSSEVSADVTYFDTINLAPNATTVPIGHPIANTQIYILDSHQQPVPHGVVGELYAGGIAVGQGYWNEPQLSAEKFIANPFGSGTLYRMGDWGRYLPAQNGEPPNACADGGSIEFIGRMDDQVKIRGFRIELGEIASAMLLFDGIREAVAQPFTDERDDQRLVAYFVADAPIDIHTLRQHLKGLLPNYMIPSAFMRLDAMPLTPSGKLNRRALPEPDDSNVQAEYVAPRNPIEQQLAAIWSNVLGVKQVGIHDNFFDLGGHSLLGTQIVSQVRAQLNIELPLRELFQTNTLEELAAVVSIAKPHVRQKRGKQKRVKGTL